MHNHNVYKYIHSCIHYGDLYSASSSLLLRSAPDPCTAKKNSFEARVECVRKNPGEQSLCQRKPIKNVLYCIFVYYTVDKPKHSFIPSGHFYSASSSPPLLRSVPDTARILCQSHRQLQAIVPMWRLERES